MKKFEDFTREDLSKLRSEICLNSLYTLDYVNSFGITAECVQSFFDGYYAYIWELYEATFGKGRGTQESVLAKFDNDETLEEWFYCITDFSWIEYEEDDE